MSVLSKTMHRVSEQRNKFMLYSSMMDEEYILFISENILWQIKHEIPMLEHFKKPSNSFMGFPFYTVKENDIVNLAIKL